MENPEQRNSLTEEIDTRLEEILTTHLGASEEYDGMSLSLAALSSCVLLAEREGEVESNACGPSDRYTEDALLVALNEMGVKCNGAVKRAITDMADNGYIQVEPMGRLLVQEPLSDFIQNLNETFPRMQGLNLVAYLVQTVDEVTSGRKDFQVAMDQLDQTLQLQKQYITTKKPRDDLPAESGELPKPQRRKPSTQSLKSALSRRLRKRQTQVVSSGDHGSCEPVVFSAAGQAKALDIQEVFSPKPKIDNGKSSDRKAKERPDSEPDVSPRQMPEWQPEPDFDAQCEANEENQEPKPRTDESVETDPETVFSGSGPMGDFPAEAKTDRDFVKSAVEKPSGGGVSDNAEPKEKPPVTEAISIPDRPPIERSPDIRSIPSTAKNEGSLDEEVEERIESFYQSLVMTCPVCHSGQIIEQNTEKGKTFFTCSSPDCVFVSWGKPYALLCPWCKNPFLVEATGKEGAPVLKCPRATCHYQQDMPEQVSTDSTGYNLPSGQTRIGSPTLPAKKPARKAKRLVRRRVVRKKR